MKAIDFPEENGGRSRIRTYDPLIKSHIFTIFIAAYSCT